MSDVKNPFPHPITTQLPVGSGQPRSYRPGDEYQPARDLAAGAIMALIGMFLLAVLFLLLLLYEQWLRSTAGNAQVIVGELGQLQRISGALGKVEQPARWVCIVTFLQWFYRAYRNLRGLGVLRGEWSPGWTIWGFLLPVANLIMPCLLMQEAWRSSNPHVESSHQLQRGAGRNSALAGWWWALWILAGALHVYLLFFFRYDPAAPERLLWYTALGRAVEAVDAGLAVALVRALTRRQARRYETCCQVLTQLPPPESPPS